MTPDEVKKIAHLARINMSEKDLETYTQQLSNIINFVEQMNSADISKADAISHPLDLEQRLRDDVVTETDQRDAFQKIAPLVEAGLYLVPKVIDEQ